MAYVARVNSLCFSRSAVSQHSTAAKSLRFEVVFAVSCVLCAGCCALAHAAMLLLQDMAPISLGSDTTAVVQ